MTSLKATREALFYQLKITLQYAPAAKRDLLLDVMEKFQAARVGHTSSFIEELLDALRDGCTHNRDEATTP